MEIRKFGKLIVVVSTLFTWPCFSMAEKYLARDFCQIEFESLKKHQGNLRSGMFEKDKRELLNRIAEITEKDCLKNYRYSVTKKSRKRKEPYEDKCDALPTKFYADKKGRKIYQLSDAQMNQLKTKLIDDKALEACVSPFLDS